MLLKDFKFYFFKYNSPFPLAAICWQLCITKLHSAVLLKKCLNCNEVKIRVFSSLCRATTDFANRFGCFMPMCYPSFTITYHLMYLFSNWYKGLHYLFCPVTQTAFQYSRISFFPTAYRHAQNNPKIKGSKCDWYFICIYNIWTLRCAWK